MKTIYLRVQVPDEISSDRLIISFWLAQGMFTVKFTEVQLPSEEEIDDWIDKYAFRVPYDGTTNYYDEDKISHCMDMKTWLLNKLKGE